MKRCLCAFVAVLGLAASAGAVSVAIVPDQGSYTPGQTVTVSIVVDATGAQDVAVFGELLYDPSILLGGSTSQSPLSSFGGFDIWVLGIAPCGGGECVAFNQVDGLNPQPVDQPAGFVISTITFTAGAVGSTNLVWNTTGPEQFYFFGLTDAPSATVQVVPEPATAALLALGLVALASNHRRNS